MALDPHSNFAYSTIATAPSPATSGTSLVVQAADGAKFPAVSFNATIWPANSQPTTTNAEIVRVTVVSTDTFTITRAQEGSSARSVQVGDQIAATITKKMITDIESLLLPVTEVTGTTQTAVSNNAYITNNAGLVTVTLPAAAAIGDVIRVAGKGAGGWKIAQNASGIIHFGNLDTTTGTGGNIASTKTYDAVTIECIVANNEWRVFSSIGNITIV